MADHDFSLLSLGRNELVAYRAALAEQYAKEYEQLSDDCWMEAVQCSLLARNLPEDICGFNSGDNESLYQVLKREEIKVFLDSIDRHTLFGTWNYVLIILLPCTDICYVEAMTLTICNIGMGQGYHVAIIQHGKGNKCGLAKLPGEVRQVVDEYLIVVGCEPVSLEAPFFVSFRKDAHPQEKKLPKSGGAHREAMRVCHRASYRMQVGFITLAFERGAYPVLVQDGARQKSARTMRRHQRRRSALHKNAVDFV